MDKKLALAIEGKKKTAQPTGWGTHALALTVDAVKGSQYQRPMPRTSRCAG